MDWGKILSALPKWVFMFLAVTISVVIIYAMIAKEKRYIFDLAVGPEESSICSIPVGTVVAFWGRVAPEGWLLCNGEEISEEYGSLRELVGKNTPNLQGLFLRGLDPTGEVDPDGRERSIGHIQDQQFQNHKHIRNDKNIAEEYARTKEGEKGKDVTRGFDNKKWEWKDFIVSTTGKPINGKSGDETRPKNVAANYIIKH